MIQIDFLIEGIEVFQGIEEIIEISDIAKPKYGCLEMLEQAESYDDHTDASSHYHKIPNIGKDFIRQEVDEQVAEPLEEPQVMSEVRHFEDVWI